MAAEDEIGIGGYERIMGPNGEAHYQAADIDAAYSLLLDHYGATYRGPGEDRPRPYPTTDACSRDLTDDRYEGAEGFTRIAEIFSPETNPGRKRPFAMRQLMAALIDRDAGWLEPWQQWRGAETAIVWNTHIGGHAVTLIGIESLPRPRSGYAPNDGPEIWTAATLFPQSSKKVARAINAASGRRPVVLLANLSGFDGSPDSMRSGILEFGAEIARAVVRFEGRIFFNVVSRYHGGAYVVFSRELNDSMRVSALRGSYASVIGGAAAASAVFSREIRKRTATDPRVQGALAKLNEATDPGERGALQSRLERLQRQVHTEHRAAVAGEFDAVHTVERALRVGSLHEIIDPTDLRWSIATRLA